MIKFYKEGKWLWMVSIHLKIWGMKRIWNHFYRSHLHIIFRYPHFNIVFFQYHLALWTREIPIRKWETLGGKKTLSCAFSSVRFFRIWCTFACYFAVILVLARTPRKAFDIIYNAYLFNVSFVNFSSIGSGKTKGKLFCFSIMQVGAN